MEVDASNSSSEQKQEQQQQKRKAGAPVGNLNALRHGLTLNPVLPQKIYPFASAAMQHLRKLLEAGVMEKYGKVSPAHALLIQSACRHELRAYLSQRALSRAPLDEATAWIDAGGNRRGEPKLSTYEITKFTASLSNATDKRDRAIDKLGISDVIDSGSLNLYDTLDLDSPDDFGDDFE